MSKIPTYPTEYFVSGDGWAAGYVFKDRDYTSGYTITSEVRKRPTYKASDGDPLAVPSISTSLVGDDTKIILSLTAAQTRTIGARAWIDLQIQQAGGQPMTLVQQELEGQGDVDK